MLIGLGTKSNKIKMKGPNWKKKKGQNEGTKSAFTAKFIYKGIFVMLCWITYRL